MCPKATLTFFASNQEVTRPKSQSLFSRLTLPSRDLMAMDAILLHMVEPSFTIIRQRGMKNIPQLSWSRPYGRAGTGEIPGRDSGETTEQSQGIRAPGNST